MYLIVFSLFVGFVIYFSYGIRNSAEAALNRSSPDAYKPGCTITGQAVATEKEAFLHKTQGATGEDEEEDDDS